MAEWVYNEPGDDGKAVEVRMSDADILREYYPWWKAELERQGKQDLITEANCIEDWAVVHWAWKV